MDRARLLRHLLATCCCTDTDANLEDRKSSTSRSRKDPTQTWYNSRKRRHCKVLNEVDTEDTKETQGIGAGLPMPVERGDEVGLL